jgi:hypothetical protein
VVVDVPESLPDDEGLVVNGCGSPTGDANDSAEGGAAARMVDRLADAFFTIFFAVFFLRLDFAFDALALLCFAFFAANVASPALPADRSTLQ